MPDEDDESAADTESEATRDSIAKEDEEEEEEEKEESGTEDAEEAIDGATLTETADNETGMGGSETVRE